MFIYRDESNLNDEPHWYKFDDIDVCECKMEDDEELRSQCFGGDHSPSSFDHAMIKRYNLFVFENILIN